MQELVYVTEEYVDQLVFMPQNRKAELIEGGKK